MIRIRPVAAIARPLFKGLIVVGLFATLSQPIMADTSVVTVNQMKNFGVQRCIQQWQDINAFLSDGIRTLGSHAITNANAPDDRMAAAVLELDFSDQSVISIVSVSPTVGGGCDYTMTRIFQSEQHCASDAMESEGSIQGTLTRRVIRTQNDYASRYHVPTLDGEQCIRVTVENGFVPADN